MGAAQSGLLGNSQATQNGHVDLTRLRSAIRSQSQQDPTKQQLYALLLEEYTSTDDEKDEGQSVSRDMPSTPAVVSQEGTPIASDKTDVSASSPQSGDSDVTRKLSSNCCDDATKTSDGDSARGERMPSDVGEAAKTSCSRSDDKMDVKLSQTSVDSLPENRKRSHCSDIVAPKKKFLHGFRNHSNSMSVCKDGETKAVPPSVTSCSSSNSSSDATRLTQSDVNLESHSNSGSGMPETPGGLPNNVGVSLPTAVPNNLRIRNIIETLMNTDIIRRHLEYDGPEHDTRLPASTQASRPIDAKSFVSEEGSPRPLEPQTIQNQMQKVLPMDTHSPSGDSSLQLAKPSAMREHTGPLQLIKEQVISISPDRECQTLSTGGGGGSYAKEGIVMPSNVPPSEVTKQSRPQFAYNVHPSQAMSGHAQFAGQARQYQSAGISTGRTLQRSPPSTKAGTGGNTGQWNAAAPPGSTLWIRSRSMSMGRADHTRQSFEQFRPAEGHLAEGHLRDVQWVEGRQASQEVPLGHVNICPQIVDKNAVAPHIQPPGGVYRVHAGGSLTHGCSDMAAAKSLMLHQEPTGNRSEATYDHRLISLRYDSARQNHEAGKFEMLKHPIASQLHGSYMSAGGANSSPMSRVPSRTPELQRSPPGMYHHVGGHGCSGVGCHGCSSVNSLRQPVVTSRPHSRYDTTRWELTHQHESPGRMSQQMASPVRAYHQRESPSGIGHHLSPTPVVELTQPADIVQPIPVKGPPPLIPLTASQAMYNPAEFRHRSHSLTEGHHRNGGLKPLQHGKPEKESPLDLSERKEQFKVQECTGTADVNVPLDLSVKNVPVAVPSPPVRPDDIHYKKREVGRSFLHPQHLTPAGDAGTTQRGNNLGEFPNMSQHILKLQQSINRTMQDIDEPGTRTDPPTHPNQLRRQNVSPESPLMKQYPNMGGVTHRPPPPLWHVPPGDVQREYPSDTQRHNSRDVKMLVPLPTPAFPPGKTGMQKTSFRYGTVNILGNHPPSDILFLRCNLCGLTYGSQHSIKKHFSKVHGRDPTPEAVAVQTISDMRIAISQAGEKPAKWHGDGGEQPDPKKKTPPEQQRSNDDPCRKPDQKPPEDVEGEKLTKRNQDAKNCQALSPLRSSQKVAKAILVKRDGDSGNHLDSAVDGSEKSMMKCLQCGQDFPTRDWGVFRRHVRTHDLTPDAIYKCTVCSVGFKDVAKRRLHMSTAHSITSCMCRKCNIGFTHIGALNKHLKTAHVAGQRVDVEYRCLYCPKYFAVHDDLILHTQRHETNDNQNTDVLSVAKRIKDKAVLMHPTVTPPSQHASPDTDVDKFPYPDLTIVEDPVVIVNGSNQPAARNTSALPWKPMMSRHVPTGRTLQEMLMERMEPQGQDRKETKVVVNGTNVSPTRPPALVFTPSGNVSQDDDVNMANPAASAAKPDQNMKRRLDADQIPATEQLSKKVKPENTSVDEAATMVDEQAKLTAQSLLKDIVKTANSDSKMATTLAESLHHDKETKVSHIMQGVLRSFPVLRHKPENIREVIETLVTAELTGELPRRFTTDPVQDVAVSQANADENTSNDQQVAAREGSQKNEVCPGATTSVSVKDSNVSTETLSKTLEKSLEERVVATEKDDTFSVGKSLQDVDVCLKTSAQSLLDLQDIPATNSSVAAIAPVKITRLPKKTASEKARESKSEWCGTMLATYTLPKKAGKVRNSSHRHAASASATPSTSGQYNPLMSLQFSDFHPTLCTDHACEDNYLEKKHGHCHGEHKDDDEEDVACKEKLEDGDRSCDKHTARPCTDGPCDQSLRPGTDGPCDKSLMPCTDEPCDKSVRLCAVGLCDKSHQHNCKSALVGTSGDVSSTVLPDAD